LQVPQVGPALMPVLIFKPRVCPVTGATLMFVFTFMIVSPGFFELRYGSHSEILIRRPPEIGAQEKQECS
jgi:hypothetical protein